ncbi:MAG TPA: MFS transporter [Caulobacteraceae bacterium]|jgi:MFS family permease
MTDEAAPSGSRPAFGFVFASVLMSAVSSGLIFPILPNLIRSFFGAVSTASTAVAAEWQFIFGVTWGTMQFVAGPLLGVLSDRFGRRPVLLISLFGLSLDFLVMALAPSLPWLLVGRVLSGLTAANFATASAYVADISVPDQRAKNFGWISAGLSVGFLVGPAAAGVLATQAVHIGTFVLDPLRTPFLVAAGLCAVNWVYGLVVLPESLPAARRMGAFDWARANPVGSLSLMASRSELLPLAAINFLTQVATLVMPAVFVLFATLRYHWSLSFLGLTIAMRWRFLHPRCLRVRSAHHASSLRDLGRPLVGEDHLRAGVEDRLGRLGEGRDARGDVCRVEAAVGAMIQDVRKLSPGVNAAGVEGDATGVHGPQRHRHFVAEKHAHRGDDAVRVGRSQRKLQLGLITFGENRDVIREPLARQRQGLRLRAQRLGARPAAFVVIEEEDFGCAQRDGKTGRIEADALGVAAHHQYPGVRTRPQVRGDGAPAIRNIVGEAGERDRVETVGEADQHVVGERNPDQFRKRPTEFLTRAWGQAVCGALRVGGAAVGMTAPTGVAAPARKLEGDDDPVAGNDAGRFAGIRHDADGLMSQRERPWESWQPADDEKVQITARHRDRPDQRIGGRFDAGCGDLPPLELAGRDVGQLAHRHLILHQN